MEVGEITREFMQGRYTVTISGKPKKLKAVAILKEVVLKSPKNMREGLGHSLCYISLYQDKGESLSAFEDRVEREVLLAEQQASRKCLEMMKFYADIHMYLQRVSGS